MKVPHHPTPPLTTRDPLQFSFRFTDNSLDIKLMNGNGKTFHDEPKLATIQSTGINEKTCLLRRVNNSAMVTDANLPIPFSKRFQSRRKYDYDVL